MFKEIEVNALPVTDQNFYSTCLRAFDLEEYDYVVEVCRAIALRNEICMDVCQLHLKAAKKLYYQRSPIRKVVRRVIGYGALIGARLWSLLKMEKKVWECVLNSLHIFPFNHFAFNFVVKLATKKELKHLKLWALLEWESVEPGNVHIQRAIGQVYFEMKLFDKALKVGEKILEKAPFDLEALQLVQNAAIHKGLSAMDKSTLQS